MSSRQWSGPPVGRPTGPRLSVLVPVYNEGPTLGVALERLFSAMREWPWRDETEVIVVDDGSADGTVAACEASRWKDGLILVKHASNRGKGAAVRTGIGTATGEVLVVQDADLEYDPRDLQALLAPLMAGRADAVFGSRLPHSAAAMTMSQRFVNRALTSLANAAFGARLSDIECGYKAWRAGSSPIRVSSDRWGFDPEITARLIGRGTAIEEVQVTYTRRSMRDGKKIRWWDAVGVVATTIAMGRWLRSVRACRLESPADAAIS